MSELPYGRRDVSPVDAAACAELGRASIPSDVAAPAGARTALRAWLAEGSVPAGVVRDALLLVSELVANSVVHAGAPPGSLIGVRSGSTDTVVWFEVRDAGRTGSVARREPQPSSGLGLNYLDAAASRWGVSYGDGTTVWFELAVDGDRA